VSEYQEVNESDPSKLDKDELRIKKAREEMMGVDGMVSLDDFEVGIRIKRGFPGSPERRDS
jgi:hypothetical protein